jgi:hypothetical protein
MYFLIVKASGKVVGSFSAKEKKLDYSAVFNKQFNILTLFISIK